MSALQAYAKPRLNLPPLPPELWLQIFAFAVSVPQLYDPDFVLRHFSEPSTWGKQRVTKESLVTRRYLVQVCKQWHALASQYLYESIHIGRGRALSSLCSTLVNSQQKAEATKQGHPLGWWTKRLDVAMRDQSRHGVLEFEFLVEAIRCLPNLAVITFSVATRQYEDHPIPTSVLQTLAETCGRSLQIVNWSRSSLGPHRGDWRSFLAATPNLRAIRCPCTLPTMDTALPLPVLPSLNTLVLASGHCEEYYTNDINLFPSLREIIYLDFLPPLIPMTWEPMLRIYGPNLTTITIHYDIDMMFLQGEMDLLTALCPNLNRLDIAFRYWISFVPNLVFPSITHFGLRCWELQSPSWKYRRMFAALVGLTASALKVVQLIDHRNVADLCNRHAKVFSEGAALVKSRGFCLQDHEGRVFA